MLELPPGLPDPIFVGGAARSGTHAMARLISAHPAYHLIPVEVRFHCERKGLAGLVDGEVDMDEFVTRFREHYFRRGRKGDRGVQVIASEDAAETALADLQQGFAVEPVEAAGRMIRTLLDPDARRAGNPSWVEVSGRNVMSAPAVARMLPRARFIHMVRDGRDTAVSHRTKFWGREDLIRTLELWGRRVRAGDAAARAMPDGTVLVMHLEDLVVRRRDESFERLVEFLGLDDAEPLRDHFETRIRADAAHLERWRSELGGDELEQVNRYYERLVKDLARDGVACLPPAD